jgi:hypothetical protein
MDAEHGENKEYIFGDYYDCKVTQTQNSTMLIIANIQTVMGHTKANFVILFEKVHECTPSLYT